MSTTTTTDASASRARWEVGDYAAVGSRILAMSEELCDVAGATGDQRVLDVACGHGNTALTAARRGCHVVGIDIVPALLDRARARAAAESLPVEFREGDAQALPLPDDSFDLVLSSVGVQFVPDQEQTAAELRRVTRPGGRIGIGSWSVGPFWTALPALIAEYAPPPAGAPSPLRWGSEEGLRSLFGDGVGLRVEPRLFHFRHRSARAWAEMLAGTYPPFVAMRSAIGHDAHAAFTDDLTELGEELNADTDGAFALPMTWVVAVVH